MLLAHRCDETDDHVRMVPFDCRERTDKISVIAAEHSLLAAAVAGIGNKVRYQVHIGLFLGELKDADFRSAHRVCARAHEAEPGCRTSNKPLDDLDTIASMCLKRPQIWLLAHG